MSVNKPINLIDHKQAWELLPWLVNGTLSKAERRMVDHHVEACTLCQRELEAQREFSATIANVGHLMAEAPDTFDALNRRIDEIEQRATGLRSRGESRKQPAAESSWVHSWLGRPQISYAAATTLVIMALVISFAWLQGTRLEPQAEFRTLTNSPSGMVPGQPLLKVRLIDGVGVSEASGIFTDIGGRILEGPTVEGVYTVELLAEGPGGFAEGRVHQLRRHARVMSVEQVVQPGSDR